jgi:hypothetical protein
MEKEDRRFHDNEMNLVQRLITNGRSAQMSKHDRLFGQAQMRPVLKIRRLSAKPSIRDLALKYIGGPKG